MTSLPPPEEEHHYQVGNTETTSTTESQLDTSVATLSSPWQFDDLQPNCSSCQAAFTPINRRHHCRLCGKIFCNDCCKQRVLIPPSSIVLTPKGGKKAKPRSAAQDAVSFSPDEDPDRMLTYLSGDENKELLYGKGLEERFKLAREPLRVCHPCYTQLLPIQEELRNSNSNAMRFNHIDPTDPKRLLNSPLAFTLGHEIRKAAYTLNNLLPLPKRMGAVVASSSGGGNPFDSTTTGATTSDLQHCKETCSAISPNLGDLDGVRIPARLLEQAKGVAVLTVVKGGFGLAGVEFGTGLVVARLAEEQQQQQPSSSSMSSSSSSRWSAPSAIGTAGVSWGALVGAQVSDHVFLLMTDAAVEMLFHNNGSVQLGADVGIALGPLGRAAEADLGAAPGSVAPIYTYSLSKGLYAGVSLDGKVIFTRHKVNEKFYGRTVSGNEILRGAVPTPPAAQPLYEALTRCHFYATGNRPHRTTSTASSTSTAMMMPQTTIGTIANPVDPVMGEYGEVAGDGAGAGGGDGVVGGGGASSPTMARMPPAAADQHSYAGMSDITTDPGY